MTEERQAPRPPGSLLGGKYRLVRLIGEGAMGRVYEAQHTIVGRRFAVKVLQAELARQPALVERFHREARTAGALENENIASVLDFGHTADGVPYIVMELLVGEDLSTLLQREGPLPVPRVVEFGVQTCRGLAAAHNAGIVHRDLKPGNLFVSRRGDGTDLVKILDFGIAKLESSAEASLLNLTRTGSTMGTPLYMSPEQARGERELDHRADIYATAVILYEALTGQMPHRGDSYNELLHNILTRSPPALTALRPEIPAGLADAIHAALSPSRDQRPQSAMAFARTISGYDPEAIPLHLHRSPTALLPAMTMLLGAEVQPAAADKGGRARRRRAWLGPGIGAAAAVAVLVAGALMMSPRRDEAPATAAAARAVPSPPHDDVVPPAGPPASHTPAPESTSPEAPSSASRADPPPSAPARASDDQPAAPAPVTARPKPATRRAPPRRPARPKFDEANPYN